MVIHMNTSGLTRKFKTRVVCEELVLGTEKVNVAKKIRRYYTTEGKFIGEELVCWLKFS